MFNWHTKLMAFLSPSIIIGNNGGIDGAGSNRYNPFPTYMTQPYYAQVPQTPVVPMAAPRSIDYKVNPYTARQLSQLANQSGLLGGQSPQYQQYLAKMAGYGAGAGKTAPSVTTGDK